ncbi:MAG: hypothetical protein KJI70_00780 [Patescibacteria group bacterium]|nr:hypothetical protein [Patescibacteria group bacterium]
MKSEKTDKKKIKISNKIVYVISLLLVGLSIGAIVVFAINNWSTGYKVVSGSTNKAVQYYDGQDNYRCGYVDNYTGKSIFVPTKSPTEWSSFVNNSPANTDGCTGNSSSRPGQTSWFTSANNCGSWDYNCDGVVTKRFATVGTDNGEYSCSSGWKDYVAECGYIEDWIIGPDGNYTCVGRQGDIPGFCYCILENKQQECH